MRSIGTFELHTEPETPTHPAKVSVVLQGAQPDEHGVVYLTPECMTLDVLEGCINALQDELDLLRAKARQAFMVPAGRA
jgi:hypothetical protein